MFGAIAVCAAVTPSMAADKDVIAYREGIMNALNEHSAALGQILSGGVSDENAVSHLEAIALLASLTPKAFEPKVPGGEAKPDVWAKWPDFSKRMDHFVQATAEAAKVAREDGKEAALENILDALDCKSCHDHYRAEKK
jgi:cytochrome c556